MNCVICGNTLKGKQRKHCSKKCRYAAGNIPKKLKRTKLIEYIKSNEVCLYCKIPIVGVVKNKNKKYCSPNCNNSDFKLKRNIQNGSKILVGKRSEVGEKFKNLRLKLGRTNPEYVQEKEDLREIRTRRYNELIAMQVTPDNTDLSIFNLEWSDK